MIVKMLIEAGDMKPSPAISQKLGPLGLNMGKIIQEINKATAEFKGIRVPVSLDIDTKTKDFKIEISTPPASELLKKELKIDKGSGDIQNLKTANAAMEQIISIAKSKEEGMLANNFRAVVKAIVGTCQSLGILIEDKEPKEILEEIDQGKYDTLINQQKTELSEEKKAKLDEYFEGIKSKQEQLMKKKAEEEAAKAEAAAAPAAEGEEATDETKEAGKEGEAKPAKAEKKKK